MGFKKREDLRKEYGQETGLKIFPKGNYFIIVQMQSSRELLDEIMLTESEALAEAAKVELESLVDWNTTEDIYHQIVVEEGFSYQINQKLNKIIDKYSPRWYAKDGDSIDEGESKDLIIENEETPKQSIYILEESSDEGPVAVQDKVAVEVVAPTTIRVKKQGAYEYEIKNSSGQTRMVKGRLVVEGLAIRKINDDTFALDHMQSGEVFRVFNTEEKVLKCIDILNSFTRWDHEKAESIFSLDNEFFRYMRSLGKAIDSNHDVPKIPEKLKFRLEYYSQFFSINPENGDFNRFCNAIIKLTNMVGLETVKTEVQELLYSLMGRARNEGKVKFKESHMHMVFVGPPGTGKTEIARLISEIYGSLGYLSKGQLIEVDAEDLKGTYEGHTGDLVKEKVLEAMGGTLLIDEAYGLVDGQFGKEAVTTLIKLLDDKKGEFMAIFTGYPADIEKLLNANPGFPSRIEKKLTFNDYTVSQLSQIVQNILESTGHIIKDDVAAEIYKAVNRRAKQGTVSGSARTAGKMAAAIAKALNIRIGKDNKNEIKETNVVTVEDVKQGTDTSKEKIDSAMRKKMLNEPYEKMDKIIGLDKVKEEIRNIATVIQYDDDLYKQGETSAAPVKHMRFEGPPGTAKTTFARLVAELFKAMGALSNGHLVEVTRQDLVGGYIGHTAEKTTEVIKRAIGGVLLVDEAPTLAEGGEKDYGREAINAFIKPLEEEEDLVVIFTGYPEPMKNFLKVNPGMESRVPYRFTFSSYSAEELHQLVILQLKNTFNLYVGEGVSEKLKTYVDEQYAQADGKLDNGRWARNVAQRMKFNLARRLAEDKRFRDDIPLKEKKTTVPADVPTSAI